MNITKEVRFSQFHKLKSNSTMEIWPLRGLQTGRFLSPAYRLCSEENMDKSIGLER